MNGNKPSGIFRHILAGLFATAASSLPYAATAGGYLPTLPLGPSVIRPIPFSPRLISFVDGLLVVASEENGSGAVLAKIDPETLESNSQITTDIVPEDMAIAPGGSLVVIIGNDGTSTRIEFFDADLKMKFTMSLDRSIDSPKLAFNESEVLFVGGQSVKSSPSPLLMLDTFQTPGKILREINPFFVSSGIAGIWYDKRDDVVFVNGSSNSSFYAISAETGKLMGVFASRNEKGDGIRAFSVSGVVGASKCNLSTPAAFLVADGKSSLSLIDFDPTFQGFDIQTVVEARPRTLDNLSDEGHYTTSFFKPTTLVASSCDQSVIWLGNRYSNEIVQYARNPITSNLEKVGSISLPSMPYDFVLSGDGHEGFAIFRREGQIARFDRNISPIEASKSRVIGDDRVREIQRLLSSKGYPVGSIDGLMGPSTTRAISAVERQLGVTIDKKTDVGATLQSLQSTFKGAAAQ
jgi:hypothetical protein